jgi:hypothetical protein
MESYIASDGTYTQQQWCQQCLGTLTVGSIAFKIRAKETSKQGSCTVSNKVKNKKKHTKIIVILRDCSL